MSQSISQAPIPCIFVSDLHGRINRYENLLHLLAEESPSALFLGGDLLPHSIEGDFLTDFFVPAFSDLKRQLGSSYPTVFLILGNDDPRSLEPTVLEGEHAGLWEYIHNRRTTFHGTAVYGYSCVPPTPFRLKDWERYDVSRYCDPGCISPEEGIRTVPVDETDVKWGTVKNDLEQLTGAESLDAAVILFHSPPHDTPLDVAALDGKMIDHVPLDPHVGSIAVRRFIETRQPRVTLHGHIHESARLTGNWKTKLGRTVCLSAAHDGPELAVVRFDLASPDNATRDLL
jgi:Icc-related predicted phosphoesterase